MYDGAAVIYTKTRTFYIKKTKSPHNWTLCIRGFVVPWIKFTFHHSFVSRRMIAIRKLAKIWRQSLFTYKANYLPNIYERVFCFAIFQFKTCKILMGDRCLPHALSPSSHFPLCYGLRGIDKHKTVAWYFIVVFTLIL